MPAPLDRKRELHQALTALMKAIANGRKGAASGSEITALVQRIDAIGAEWGADAPGMLRHYLERHSYAKALDFLEGRDETEAPDC